MAGQRIGYVRVSTFDQNPERQLDSMPVDRTFTDKASGKDAKRPQLEDMMSFARTGDTVVVHSMDRLARNLDDLRRIVQALTRRGVRVEFVKEHLVFTGEDSPMANLMLSVMGAFAEFERALLRERQREGIALARQRGVYRGRKKSLSDIEITAATKNVSPIAWQNVNLHGRYEFLKQIVLLNVDIIVQGLAGMPIDCDITLAA